MDVGNNDYPLQSEYAYSSGAGASSADPALTITVILGTLLREWRLLVSGCLIGLTLAVSYIIFTPTLYRSSARILLDRGVNRYLQTNKIMDEPIFDEAEIASQIYILSSESIVVPVIRSMNLAHDSEFVGPPNEGGGAINKLKKIVKQYIGWNNGANATMDPEAALEQTAVEAFFKRLNVERADVASVINVTFASEDPNKAAGIANAVADTYIATTLESKFKLTKIVSQWLQDRLVELKAQATDADRALQNYKIANNLVNGSKDLLNSEQLLNLNTQLTNARIAMAEAKERLDNLHVKMTGEGTLSTAAMADGIVNRDRFQSFTLNNAEIVKLRAEYRDLAGKATELEASVGSGHITVVKLHKKMEELLKLIKDEEGRIADFFVNEYQLAKTREGEIAATLAQSVGEAGTSGQAKVTMRELESSADTLRNLYNGFLQKFKEINTIETQTIPIENARILARATPASKSSKKAVAVLAGSIAFGLFLGAGAALAREWAADVFRTPKAVEQLIDIHCVVLPMIKANRGNRSKIRGSSYSVMAGPVPAIGTLSSPDRHRRDKPGDDEPDAASFSLATDWEQTASFQGSTKSTLIEEFVLDSPYSRFTETLRNVKALINTAQLADGAKVIGIVSSLPKEGKTTIAANLAALMIASSGARTLIIDSDLHLRLLTAKLAPDAREGLIEALIDPSRLAAIVSKLPRSGLDFLPCVLSTRVPNAAELLGSPKMGELLVAARKAYDYVIIEIAPIMSVVDAKMIERFIDRFILVVEWGQTKRSLVLEALAEAPVIRDRLIGIVLNKADPSALRVIEAYKGNRFGNYYQE